MSYQLSTELHGHEGDVRCVTVIGSTIVSGSRDGTLRWWKPVNIPHVHEGENMTDEMEAEDKGRYELSATVIAHDGKFVSTVIYARHIIGETRRGNSGFVVSGGHDNSIKVWAENPDTELGTEITPLVTLLGHTDVVCDLAVTKAGVLISASWDNDIRLWKDGECTKILKGHEHAVWCLLALGPNDDILWSGSADKAVRVWNISESQDVDVDEYEDGYGAGAGVRSSQSSQKQTQTQAQPTSSSGVLEKHQDAVRSLIYVPDLGVFSASNDGSIILWDTISHEALQMWEDHSSPSGSSFLYTTCFVPSCYHIASGGEGREVKIWSNGHVIQQIQHPKAVWDLAAVAVGEDSEDIVSACEDGVIRIWSQNPDRIASESTLKAYSELLAQQKRPSGSVSGMNVSELPSVEDLLAKPGTKPGQSIVARDSDDGKAYAFTWDHIKSEWARVGEVVDGPDSQEGGGSGGGFGTSRPSIHGKEYDYVFPVEIEGRPGLKLGYNIGEDPYMIAQQWINDNEIPMEYLAEVGDFIIQQVPDAKYAPMVESSDPLTGAGRYIPSVGQSGGGGGGGGGGVDPYTGSSRYIPSSGPTATTTAAAASGGVDPYTGGSRYIPTEQQQQHGSAHGGEREKRLKTEMSTLNAVGIPSTHCILFDQVNSEAMLKKIVALSAKCEGEGGDKRIEEGALGALDVLCSRVLPSGLGGGRIEAIAQKMKDGIISILHWSENNRFVGLDLCRLLALHPNGPEFLLSPYSTSTSTDDEEEEKVTIFLWILTIVMKMKNDTDTPFTFTFTKSCTVNRMLMLRLCSNMFKLKQTRDYMVNTDVMAMVLDCVADCVGQGEGEGGVPAPTASLLSSAVSTLFNYVATLTTTTTTADAPSLTEELVAQILSISSEIMGYTHLDAAAFGKISTMIGTIIAQDLESGNGDGGSNELIELVKAIVQSDMVECVERLKCGGEQSQKTIKAIATANAVLDVLK